MQPVVSTCERQLVHAVGGFWRMVRMPIVLELCMVCALLIFMHCQQCARLGLHFPWQLLPPVLHDKISHVPHDGHRHHVAGIACGLHHAA
jgi:hypothetical protein